MIGFYVSTAMNNTANAGGAPAELKKAIWAVYHHKRSTDKKPDHKYCPKGAHRWCPYRRAEFEGQLKSYKHKNNIDPDVMLKIKPLRT